MKKEFRAKIKGVNFKCLGVIEAMPELWSVSCEHSNYNGVCSRCALEVLNDIHLMDILILRDSKWIRYVDYI
jgi:hypothetical protein